MPLRPTRSLGRIGFTAWPTVSSSHADSLVLWISVLYWSASNTLFPNPTSRLKPFARSFCHLDSAGSVSLTSQTLRAHRSGLTDGPLLPGQVRAIHPLHHLLSKPRSSRSAPSSRLIEGHQHLPAVRSDVGIGVSLIAFSTLYSSRDIRLDEDPDILTIHGPLAASQRSVYIM